MSEVVGAASSDWTIHLWGSADGWSSTGKVAEHLATLTRASPPKNRFRFEADCSAIVRLRGKSSLSWAASTRQRRIERTVEDLLEGRKRPCC